MTKLTRADLLPYEQYKNLHEKFLKEVIAEKKIRRMAISDKISGLFESKLTVFYQIQEMIRAEQITNESYIDEMLEVYNDLLPENNELTMTLFIEIPNQEELRAFNKTIVGIEDTVQLVFDDQVVTSYEPNDDQEDNKDEAYTQSVHYLHFPFTEEQKQAFLKASNVRIKVNHQNYQAEKNLSNELAESLKGQLANL